MADTASQQAMADTAPIELDPDSLGEVVREAHVANTKWYDIGLQLGIPTHILDEIQKQYPSTSECFREMLKEWLKGDSTNWQRLEAALKSPTVREYGLASKLRRRYSSQTSEQSDTDSTSSFTNNPTSSLSSSVTSTMSSFDMVPYGCGCGDCTFNTYIDDGCPNPIQTTTSFPFLNTDGLSETEKQLLYGRLYEESQQITRKFSHLSRIVCESLIDRKVPLKKLVRSLRDLKAFQPATSKLPLLQDRFLDLKQAEEIDDVFDVLKDYTSFFSFEIIEHLVQELGDSSDRGELEAYRGHLMEYCKRSIFECPTYSPLKKGHATLVLKVDDTIVEDGNMKDLQQLVTRVSRALSLGKHTLRLCSVERGCIQLVCQLPVSVANELFPLSVRQKEELGFEGVAKLLCDKWRYTLDVTRRRALLGLDVSTTPDLISPEGPPPPLPPKSLYPTPPPKTRVTSHKTTAAAGEDTKMTLITEKEILQTYRWYHGNITRAEAEDRLKKMKKDSFLIRRKDEVGLYALSEIYNGITKHYIVKKTNGVYESLYELEHTSFHTIPEMVEYLKKRFFFQPCQRKSFPKKMVQLLQRDWIIKTTPTSDDTTADLETDCTGDSGYGGTGEGTGGFPTAIFKKDQDAEKKDRYERLRMESIEPYKPYTQVRREDEYKDYKDIGQLEARRKTETMHSQVTAEEPRPPRIYDRVGSGSGTKYE